MIPKKLHYCWLSDDPMPELLNNCVESWKKLLPDFEIVKWDLNKFPLSKNVWVKEAFERGKYAFAADYIRLYALATEGGIYLDSDVEVIKPFAELMDLPYFICKENSPKGIEAAIIGAERDTNWVRTCLDYYRDKHFVNSDGTMNSEVLPEILKKRIEENYELKYISSVSDFDHDKKVVSVLPSEYFSPKNYVTKKIHTTRNTRTIHHFAGSWQPAWKKVMLRLWVPFSVKFPALAEIIKKKIH